MAPLGAPVHSAAEVDPGGRDSIMLVINIYRWRDDAHTTEAGQKIMDAFGKRGSSPDEVAHYVFADGTGGVVITDGDDTGWAYRNSLDFIEFMDMDRSESRIALTLEDALPHVVDRLGG